MKIAYLGPKGSFSEQAAKFYDSNIECIPYHSISEVIYSIEHDLIEMGIVPIENSIEGTVNITMDKMIFDSNLYILNEIVIPIDQNFIVSKNYNGGKITKVLSHPQGIAQCQKFLETHYAQSEQITTSSTSEAARIVSESKDNWAAIGNLLCAQLYDMKILHKSIQDTKLNETRFIVISKKSDLKFKPNCKTSIAFSTNNEPGALFKILNIIALWDINMTKIISRPMKNSIGEYVFFVEVEGHISDEDMQNAFKMIQRKTSFYKLFGSYTVSKKEIQKWE